MLSGSRHFHAATMKNLLLCALLVSVIAVASSFPKSCRGVRCRHLRPVSPGRVRVPVQIPGNKLPIAPVRRPRPPVRPSRRPAPPARKVPITTPPPPPSVTHLDMVTNADGEEVREAGVNGWLASPTPAPENNSSFEKARTQPTPLKTEKPGSCDTPKGFGIKCMDRLDQCTTDMHCPGTTKCCMVGECGYLCVKPKPVSTGPKEVTKQAPSKKIKGDKNSQAATDLATSGSEISEAVELPEGSLKPEDIIEIPDEMKAKMEEEAKRKTEAKKEVEATKGQDEVTPEIVEQEGKADIKQKPLAAAEGGEEKLTKEAEKVVEKIEEFVEEELKQIQEKLEPSDNGDKSVIE